MTCKDSNCGYYWQEENENYPHCHFDGVGNTPCEEEDWDYEPPEIDDDFGFDPYEGCYTYDC